MDFEEELTPFTYYSFLILRNLWVRSEVFSPVYRGPRSLARSMGPEVLRGTQTVFPYPHVEWRSHDADLEFHNEPILYAPL